MKKNILREQLYEGHQSHKSTSYKRIHTECLRTNCKNSHNEALKIPSVSLVQKLENLGTLF